jgi:hypothetical protein
VPFRCEIQRSTWLRELGAGGSLAQVRERWWYPSWREFLVGSIAGFATNELWLRRNIRRFVDAVEQGHMEAAEMFADRAYLTNLLLWLRRSDSPGDTEDDSAGT